ncbi:MAG: hypothetical protein KA794_10980 [Candidatus Obscuribacter sp.]|nr:hypothetical protein [Candidatus Obscuribacter sp.]MBP7577218.1 hypothetical protein [Candidatus Obscuribacter sp.]
MSASLPHNSINNAPGPRVRSTTNLERTVISCYLATFFIVVGTWLIPDKCAPNKWVVTQYTWPIMSSMGWTQCWTLFCPEPRDVNVNADALVHFQDGTVKIYEFPRTQKMDLLTKFRRERTRKLFVDNLCWPNISSQYLPSIARYIARANDDANNPPDMVTLLVNRHMTPLPDPKNWVYRDQLPEHTEKSVLFTYKVQPDDLK